MHLFDRIREDPSLITEAISDPRRAVLELNRLYYQRRQGVEYNTRGTDIFEDEDWDNLIILDACRHDTFAEQAPSRGTLESRESRGSASEQFIRGNFTGKTLHDVVYVSANRWFLHIRDELDCELHAHHDVERTESLAVSEPEAVTEAALEWNERYPHKRLIVHYMQPHLPFLGEHSDLFTHGEGKALHSEKLVSLMQSGRATREDLLAAYRDNLRLALDEVETLLDQLVGKTVITADHGELLGERISPFPVSAYCHPHGVYVDELTRVPWHVVSDGERKDVRAEAPSRSRELDAEGTEQTLQDLGYL